MVSPMLKKPFVLGTYTVKLMVATQTSAIKITAMLNWIVFFLILCEAKKDPIKIV
jgi:hypothetical protein